MNNQSIASKAISQKRAVLFPLLVIALSLVVFLALITVYSADDFWYSTFLDHGIAAYFSLMKEHYLTFNGRVLVHFFAQIILHVGNALFALFLVGICVLIPGAVTAMDEKRERNLDELLLCVLLFTAGILMLPRGVMVEGVLWISASCNYALPTGMVFFEILLLRRFTRRHDGQSRRYRLLLYAYCFLCGATTEQMGAVSVLMAFCFALRCFARRDSKRWACLIAAVFSCCGLLSIFLSPSTRQRLADETVSDFTVERGFIAHIKNMLWAQAASLSQDRIVIAAVAILFAWTGWILLRKNGIPKRCGIIWLLTAAVCLALFLFSEGTLFHLSYCMMLCLLFAQTVVWFIAGYEGIAFVMLASVASVGIMLFSGTWGDRICLPFCLCVLAVLAWILTGILMKRHTVVFLLAAVFLSAAAFAVICVQLPGYWYNYKLNQNNKIAEAQARESGSVYYSIDYDLDYTHTKPFQNGYYYSKWMESIGIDESICDVYFYSEGLPVVYVNGARAPLPAVYDDSGQWLLPLRYTVETLGGTLELHSANGTDITIYLGGQCYEYIGSGYEAAVRWQDQDGEARCVVGKCSIGYYLTCVSENLLTEAFGMNIVHEDGRVCIYAP